MQLNPYKIPAQSDAAGNIIPARSGVTGSPQYQDLLDANPYRNREYSESPWQKFLGALGFRTEADAWRENMAVQAAEYDAGIAQQAYAEQYNNPVEQVARMRAAGLNPDIDGGQSISSGQAATPGEDPSTPMQATSDMSSVQGVLSTAMSVGNAVMSCFSTALGMASSVQGIRRNHLDNVFKSIQNESAMAGFAQDMIPFFIPSTPEQSEDGSTTWYTNALQMAQMFTGKLPKKMQRKFLSQVTGYLNSAPTERKAYQEWRERVSSRKGYFSESSTFYSEADDTLRIIADGLSDMNMKIFKATQSADLAAAGTAETRAKNDQEYLENLDASLQAQTENSANKVSKENSDMVGIMRESLNNIVSGLKKAADKNNVGGYVARGAMVLISMVQLWLSSQGAPSISRSSSAGSSESIGRNFSSGSSNQSSSFSIGW